MGDQEEEEESASKKIKIGHVDDGKPEESSSSSSAAAVVVAAANGNDTATTTTTTAALQQQQQPPVDAPATTDAAFPGEASAPTLQPPKEQSSSSSSPAATTNKAGGDGAATASTTTPVASTTDATPTMDTDPTTPKTAANGNDETTNGSKDKRDRTDRNEEFSVPLKAQYIVHERPSSLPPLRTVCPPADDQNPNKKRKRGAVRITNDAKLCLTILRGETCRYGDQCKYSHDLQAYLKGLPPYLTDYVAGGCPIFRLTGQCAYGPTCRLAPSHETIAQERKQQQEQQDNVKSESTTSPNNNDTGDNNNNTSQAAGESTAAEGKEKTKNETVKPSDAMEIDKTEKKEIDKTEKKEETGKVSNNKIDTTTKKPTPNSIHSTPQTLNVLSKETLTLLRKKKYPFRTKRFNEKGKSNNDPKPDNNKNNKNNKSTSTVSSVQPIDLSAWPSKERKLIDFSDKVYVAPLTTVGNLPFRRIMKKYGADITCGEMALSTNLIQGQPSEWALFKRHPDEDLFGLQVAGGYPDQLTRVAELIAQETQAVDFVDLNLGCPLDMLCNKGAGAALMNREKHLQASVSGMLHTLSTVCPVTIKMRTGWDSSKPFAHDLVTKIQQWNHQFLQQMHTTSSDASSFQGGVAAIMIHGRSRLQRYSKEADWNYIGSSVARSQSSTLPAVPVIGNGDIFSYTDYEKILELRKDHPEASQLSTCAMLGRGALIKPWLPTEIKERRHWDISASERLDMLKDFVKFGLEHWGTDPQGINTCRRFLLEWLSFLHRYVPVGLLEVIPQHMNQRPPPFMCGRSDLETLMLSPHSSDWIHISEMLLGPAPEGFQFEPKHKAKGYANSNG